MEREVEAAVVQRISAWVSFARKLRPSAWVALAQKLGPYLLLEILLPGGTLIALLLFLYQRKQLAEGAADMPVIASAIGTLRTVYNRVSTWLRRPHGDLARHIGMDRARVVECAGLVVRPAERSARQQ